MPGEQEKKSTDQLIDPKMRSFMYGQFANLFKFAFWWVALSPLLYALLDGSTAIGVGRIVYNSALCLSSPFGPLLVEHISPRNVVMGAAAVRFVVWCVLLPIGWICFDTSLVNAASQAALWVFAVIMLLLDGVSVGLSSVLDIDMMGIDIMAGYLGREVTEEHRNQFNSRQELFFSICFIIFAPGVSFLGLALNEGFDHWNKHSTSINLDQIQSGTLSAMFFVTFFIATILQFVYFWGLTRDDADGGGEEEGGEGQRKGKKNDDDTKSSEGTSLLSAAQEQGGAGAAAGAGGEAAEEEDTATLGEKMCGILGDLKESFDLVISHRAIFWRLIFFGFELAFEDASVVVLAAQVGIRAEWMGNGNAIHGSIWTSIIVAVGKVGAAAASFGMMKYYHPPENIMGHTKLFISIGLSTLVILGVPFAFDGYSSGNLSALGARAVTLASFLLYFFLSTLPKLGLMSLLQTMVSQVENGWRAFAFIAILATTIDSVVIMALSLLFTQAENTKHDDAAFSRSLWITCYVFLAHGLLETIVGPLLVLRPAAADAEEFAKKQKLAEEEEAKKQQKKDEQDEQEERERNDDTNSIAVQPSSASRRASTPRLLMDEQASSGGAPSDGSGNEPNQPGQYSARAISVPVPISVFSRHSGLINNGGPGNSASPRAPSNLGGGGSFSARGRPSGLATGGQSMRYGGLSLGSPRHPSNLGGGIQRDSANAIAAGGGGVGTGAGGMVVQTMLGRSGPSVTAASVIIPRRPSFQHVADDQTAGAGSLVRSGKALSRLG